MERLQRAIARSVNAGDAGGWVVGSCVIAALIVLPLIALAAIAARGSGDLWPHLVAYVLPRAFRDTLLLLAGVGVFVIVIGTGLAWLMTAYDFPGRRSLEWALLLPLSVPTYIIAFAYLDVLHPVGPVQSGLRAMLGIANPRDLWFPEVRSLGGCILLFSFVLYPYVFLTTRAMFLMQAGSLIDVSRTLGAGRARVFFSVAVPLARPAIAAGTSLALMEALNDFGACEFLGVQTLTVSIYATWINRSNLPGAAQIAILMLVIVASLILMERWARQRQRFVSATQRTHRATPQQLTGATAWLAVATASLPVLFGFLIPASYLALQTGKRLRFAGIPADLIREIVNTVAVAGISTAVALVFGLCLAYTARIGRTPLARGLLRSASLGYAVPGTVLAIGLLTPLAALDGAISSVVERIFHISTGLIVSGSGLALVYAYVARFLAVSASGIESGFQKLPASLDHAARALGETAWGALHRVHLPLIRPALGAAALLVFIDCMKELPATLLLRPLNFETLATHLYGEASRGTYEDGALAALCIVVFGLIPVILLARFSRRPTLARDTLATRAAQPAVAGLILGGEARIEMPRARNPSVGP